MLAAVFLASPVIIMTLTPAVWQSSMAYGTSGRIGSMIHTIPMKVAFDSNSSYFEVSDKSYT
jgi:hypothetical protein